jgi:hypothetical protein
MLRAHITGSKQEVRKITIHMHEARAATQPHRERRSERENSAALPQF